MRSFIILLTGIFVVLLNFAPLQAQEDSSGKSVEAKAVMVSEVPMGWTTQAILSTYVGDDHAEGYIDLLIPLLQGDDGMIFLYPRFGLSSDIDPGYSMGLGARHYIASIDAIIGGNLFYDRYDSNGGNYYDQLGLGLEVLTRWVDARFNYYIPDSSQNVIDKRNTRSRSQSTSLSWGQPFATGYTIRQPYTTTTTTTTVNQLFERFEDTMEGFDAEVGVLTPWLEQYVALRWFAGYYDFNNRYGADLNGVKARAELRFSSKLAIDATYYQDEEVTGSNWLFGFRVNIPIYMENLSQGRSPFEGSFAGMFDGVNLGGRSQSKSSIRRGGVGSTYPSAYAPSPFAAMAPAPSFSSASSGGSTVRDRMTEEVMRLSGARTSESDFIENLAKRDVDVDIDEVTRIAVIDDSIVFVSNGRGTLAGPGTFENPLNTIQGGVNRASTLFGNRGDVFVAGTGTQYVEDVIDTGSSVKIWGGSRGFPVNGGRRFTYGSQPVLDGGFIIDNTPAFLLSGFTVINGNTTGLGDGIHVENVGEVDILWNSVRNVSQDGIDIEFDGAVKGSVRIIGNTVTNSVDDAIDFDIENGAMVSLFVDRNRLFNSGSDGMEFDIEESSVVTALITNNLINGTSGEGLEVDQDNTSRATMRILSNRIINTGDDPLDIDLDDMSFGRYQVARNVFSSIDPPATDYIDIDTDDTATLNLQIFGNTSSQNFNFDEVGASTFLLENTLGTNVLTGGAIFDIDPSIMPYVPFGTFGFPAP